MIKQREMFSEQSSLGVDAIKLTASKAFTLIIFMVASMLISRYRTISEFGTYSQLQLVISVFSSFFMFGLPNSINYFLPKAKTIEEESTFLSNYYTLSTMLSLFLGIALALTITPIEKYFKNADLSMFSYFLVLYPWSTITVNSIDNVMVVYKRINSLMIFKMAYGFLMLLIIYANHLLNHSFASYMYAFTALNLLAGIVVIGLVNGRMSLIKPNLNRKLLKDVFSFSIPIGLSTLVGTLNVEVDKLYIGYVTNTEQLGIYTNAAKELPITILASSVSAVLLPQIVRMVNDGRKNTEIMELWRCAMELSTIVISFMVFGIFTYSKEVMTILYSEKYLPGEGVFKIYTLNLLLRSTYFGMVLNAYGKTKDILYCSIISLLTNIILNPILFHIFGIVGPAISTFIAILVMQYMQLYKTSKLTGVKMKHVFPYKGVFEVVLFNILLSCVFYTLKRYCPLEKAMGEIPESIVFGLLWATAFLWLYRRRIRFLWDRIKA